MSVLCCCSLGITPDITKDVCPNPASADQGIRFVFFTREKSFKVDLQVKLRLSASLGFQLNEGPGTLQSRQFQLHVF